MDRSRDPGVGDKRQEQIAAAPASNTPVPSPPSAEPQKRERQEEQKKTKASVSDGERTSAGGNTGNVTMAEQTQADESRRDGERIATARGRTPRAKRSDADKSAPSLGAVSEKEDSGEIRNVGGRRFHRRGSAWVDAAFTSSRPAIDVRRGSEQYRALVADEPGLRSISEQLSGEVIVVWKSRAYRFH